MGGALASTFLPEQPRPKDYVPLPGGDQRWEVVTKPEEDRMVLNGETKAQMQYIKKVKKAGGVSQDQKFGNDTSQDMPWDVDDSKTCMDRYTMVTSIIWLGIKLPVLILPMLLLTAVPMGICRLFVSALPDGTERIVRSKVFDGIYVLALIGALPAIMLVFISLSLDYIMYYIFSMLYVACTWRWKQAMKSHRMIDPYRHGPSICLHGSDLMVALMGQCARKNFGETWWNLSLMFLLMPWLKFYINCNPWTQDLDHRLCQQISTEMKDLGSPDDVANQARIIISRARQFPDMTKRTNIWGFVPHYPYPPSDRRWALGLQAGGSRWPIRFTLIVHTTHAICDVDGCTEQFVLSNSCEQPIYRVMLWYSNPFHFLTGWVEASVSTGMPSQPEKFHGGEHPMWLVTGKSPQVASREAWTGSGWIDDFFDYWLPVFVHEMRRARYAERFKDQPDGEAKALQIADDKYQEVYSQDGKSRPIETTGRNKVDEEKRKEDPGKKSALTEYEETAEKTGVRQKQKVTGLMNKLADTEVGKMFAEAALAEDAPEGGGPPGRSS